MSFFDYVPGFRKSSAFKEKVAAERAAARAAADAAASFDGRGMGVGGTDVGNCGVDWSLYTPEGIDLILLGKAYRTYHSPGNRLAPGDAWADLDADAGLPEESKLLPMSRATPGWQVALTSPISPADEAANLLMRDDDGTRFGGCRLAEIMDRFPRTERLVVAALRAAQDFLVAGKVDEALGVLRAPNVLEAADLAERQPAIDEMLATAARLEMKKAYDANGDRVPARLPEEERVAWFERSEPLREDEIVARNELTRRIQDGCERFVERGWIIPAPAVQWDAADDGRDRAGGIERCRFAPAIFAVAEARIRGTPYAKAAKSRLVGAPQEVVNKVRIHRPWAYKQFTDQQGVGT